ncbi:hypothetical protein QQ045_002794 [Rhodiola kirilowii]
MARVLVSLVLLLSVAGHSNGFPQEASFYCLCKDDVAQSALLAAFDLACDTGADCSAIVKNETCYDLMTPKSRCDYAANGYFQNTGGCDFNGVAAIITTHNSLKMPPACVYQSPGPVAAGRGRYYFGTRALPPNYFWPGIVPFPETGGADDWSIDEVLLWLTYGCLMLVLVSPLLS